MSKAYSSNLTQSQWELRDSLIPPAKPGGRPREVEIWEVLNAIFYVLTQGCAWRNLPADFPKWQTVYTYFRNWRIDGTWVKIHDRLREWTRVAHDRYSSLSEAIVDSQSVRSAAMSTEPPLLLLLAKCLSSYVENEDRACFYCCFSFSNPIFQPHTFFTGFQEPEEYLFISRGSPTKVRISCNDVQNTR
jgi:transposase